ncbi:MAG: redoxin domain-containing protein [Tepidisphaeraceae bacterium]
MIVRSLAFAVVCASLSLHAPARAADAPQRPVQTIMEVLAELNLTDDQRRQLRPILEQTRQALQQARADGSTMDPRDAQAAIREQLDDAQKRIAGVLTDEQRKVFETRLAELRQNAQKQKENGAPATTQPIAKIRGAGPMVARLVDALDEIKLTEEQKPQVNKVLTELAGAVRALREQGDDPQVLRQKARGLQVSTREKLMLILTEEQQRQLMTKLAASEGERPSRRDGNEPAKSTPPDNTMMTGDKPVTGSMPMTGISPDAGNTMMGGTMMGATATPATQPDRRADPNESAKPTLGVGDALPQIELVRLDGRPFSTKALLGRPAVVVFGSYSSPNFRDRMPAIDALAKQFGQRATFVVLYTVEAHPAGKWDTQRNVDDNVKVDAQANFEARVAAARVARDKLKLSSVEFFAEPWGEPLSKPLATQPNGAIVIDGKGVIVARQRWAEASAIEVHLLNLARE